MRKFLLLLSCLVCCVNLFGQAEWPIFSYGNICSFRIPPTLELRDKNSTLGSCFEIAKGYWNLSHKDEIVFQPNGGNSGEKDNIKKMLSSYARIMIRCIPTEDIDQSDVAGLTQYEIDELNEIWKQEIVSFLDGPDFIWYKLTRKVIAGKYVLVTKYQRGAAYNVNDGPVIVEEFKFFLDGKLLRFTLSYRLKDSHIWKNDFSKIMSTLSFN